MLDRRDNWSDITSPSTVDNETWNTCPKCGRSWKDELATPGLIHRTRLCKECIHDSRRA